LTVERLPPFVVIVFKSIFILNNSGVGLDSGGIEELFIDFFISILMGSTKLISLADGLFHL
jgi:hypothetical protein